MTEWYSEKVIQCDDTYDVSIRAPLLVFLAEGKQCSAWSNVQTLAFGTHANFALYLYSKVLFDFRSNDIEKDRWTEARETFGARAAGSPLFYFVCDKCLFFVQYSILFNTAWNMIRWISASWFTLQTFYFLKFLNVFLRYPLVLFFSNLIRLIKIFLTL